MTIDLNEAERIIFDAYVNAALAAMPGDFDKTGPSITRTVFEASAYGYIAALRDQEALLKSFVPQSCTVDEAAANIEGGVNRGEATDDELRDRIRKIVAISTSQRSANQARPCPGCLAAEGELHSFDCRYRFVGEPYR